MGLYRSIIAWESGGRKGWSEVAMKNVIIVFLLTRQKINCRCKATPFWLSGLKKYDKNAILKRY